MKCRWFLRCESPATGLTPHALLGEVLTCDRCHRFATGLERGAANETSGGNPVILVQDPKKTATTAEIARLMA